MCGECQKPRSRCCNRISLHPIPRVIFFVVSNLPAIQYCQLLSFLSFTRSGSGIDHGDYIASWSRGIDMEHNIPIK